MKKIVTFASVVLCSAAMADTVLIDSTLAGGNGGFEYGGAQTTANGWQSGPGYIRQYADTDTGHASNQKPFNGGSADAWHDTIMPGWTMTSDSPTSGFDSRVGVGGVQMHGGVNNITGDSTMVNDTYAFANPGGSSYLYSDDFGYSFQEGDTIKLSFYAATRDPDGSNISIRMGTTGNRAQYTLGVQAVASGSVGQVYNFEHTIQASDSYEDWANLCLVFTGVGVQSSVDDVSLTVIPEPATLGLVAAFGGGVVFIRRIFQI